jgi:hypothetical protein
MNGITSAAVFLAAPAILTSGQQKLLERWQGWLEEELLHVVRLDRSAYGPDPLRALNKLLSGTDGVILLGFRQLNVRAGTWRPQTEEEAPAADWWTTPWLHLEAGMATALGLPILVAPDEGVTEGVFSPDTWNSQVNGGALTTPGKGGREWLELVRRHWLSRGSSIT